LPDQPLQIPALTIRIGFAGHRSLDHATLAGPLSAAFALAAEAVALTAACPVAPHQGETIADAYAALRQGAGREPKLDLLVGYAPGADRVATRLWREAGHGGIHACFPFADHAEPRRIAWTDGPDCIDPALKVVLDRPAGLDHPFEAVTVLDGGASALELPCRNGHLDQARWLARWADVLIVAWNGDLAGGTGGTADTVALALQKSTPVIWIDVADAGMATRLIDSDRLWLDQSFSELVDALDDADRRAEIAPVATAQSLAALLAPVLAPPSAPPQTDGGGHDAASDEEAAARRDYAGPDPLAPAPWAGWGGILGYVRGRALFGTTKLLAAGWAGVYRSLGPEPDAPRVQTGTPDDGGGDAHPLIEAAFREADRRANLYGDLHRAMQALLLVIAVLAVTVATVPAIAPELKFSMVAIELGLLGCAYLARQLSFFATSHQRWSDIRRLAERLRALRATWPLGFDVGDDRASPAGSWTEWFARAMLRAAGPPRRIITQAEQAVALAAARHDPDGIVRGQAIYNAKTARRMHRLQEALHLIELSAFWTLITALAIFLLLYQFYLGDLPDDHGRMAVMKHLIGGVMLMLSAIIPTIAAACLAIDAKLGIEENARRSTKLAEDFSNIERKMAETTSSIEGIELLRSAARLLTKDVDGWRDAAVRRRIAML
jgi:hypothetical protein